MPELHGIQGIAPRSAIPHRRHKKPPYPWELKKHHQPSKEEFRTKLEALLRATYEREKLPELDQ